MRPIGDVGFGNRVFLSSDVDINEQIPLFPSKESCLGISVGEGEGLGLESLVDVSVWVEDVFKKAFDPAIANAIELGPDEGALATELMADLTGLGEKNLSLFRVPGLGGKLPGERANLG